MTTRYEGMDGYRLGRSRQELIQELGLVEEELMRRRAEDRHVTKASEQVWTERSGQGMKQPDGFRRTTLVDPKLGFNCYNIQAFIAEMPPGADAGAYHKHGEAIKYYLSGRGIEIIGDKRYEVEAGDTCFVPANVWHGTQNPGPEPLRVLAITTASNPVLVPSVFRMRDDLKDAPLGD